MSFAIYYILKNPEILRKLQTEIYTVVGDQPIQCEDLDHLHYLTGECSYVYACYPISYASIAIPCASSDRLCVSSCVDLKLTDRPAILRETLRLQPPAFIRVVYSVEDTTIGGGRYAIPAGSGIALLIREARRDPAVWGADVSRSLLVCCLLLGPSLLAFWPAEESC